MIKKVLLLVLLLPLLVEARRFFDDDPLEKMPPPLPVKKVTARRLSAYHDFFLQTFAKPGERQPPPEKIKKEDGYISAQAVNTLGDAPDSAWFTNRIGSRPMSIEELVSWPRRGNAPSENGKWSIVAAKTSGITPGFTIKDAEGRRYVLKFDPMTNPEMSTSADVIGSVAFHALGYNVPENYVVYFDPGQLVIGAGTTIKELGREERPMQPHDVQKILDRVPRTSEGRLRGLASYFLSGKPLGEFRYHGTRPDDPNDIVPHEHRRDLRGLFVFAAWLGHDDARAINTLDTLVEENGVPYIRHHLVDFGSILGSASVYPNSSRSGNEHLFDWRKAGTRIITLGLYVYPYYRLDYKDFPSVGRFDYRLFDPENWTTDEPNPAFKNRLPDDTYWGAKKVMAFTDGHIRAMVEQAKYSNPDAQDWVIKCLIERRDAIGRKYFERVLPLDNFEVSGNRLQFEDLAVKYGFAEKRDFSAAWAAFDNESEENTPIEGVAGFDLPSQVKNAHDGAYFSAKIAGSDPKKTVTVYIRKQHQGFKVVGIDRTW